MDIKNCRKCKKLFNYIGGEQVCPSCREKIEEDFQKVKKYLFENRNSTIKDVAENCEVEEQQIRQWVREERLEFSSGIDSDIVCENCGAPISSGKYCNKCKVEMINALNSVGRKPVESDKPIIKKSHENKMRFLNNH